MIVEYDSDGRITHVIHDPVPEHMAGFLADQGHRFIDLPVGEPCDIFTYYVVDGEVRRRPDYPATASVSGRKVTITGMADDVTAAVVIEGETIPLDATEFELDEAGPLTVVISPPWPYLEARHDLEIE